MIFFLLIPLIAVMAGSALVYKWNKQGTLVTSFSSVFFATILTAVMFVISFTFADDQWEGFNVWVWLILIAKGFAWLLQVWLWVKAIKHVPVSIADPFTLIKMLLLLGGSWLVFSDTVSVVEITLVFVIFGACFTMGMLQNKTEKKSNNFNYLKGLMWIFLWVVCSAVSTLGTRYVGDQGVNVFTYTFLNSLFAFVVLIGIMLVMRWSIRETFKISIREKLQYAIGITDIAGTYFYLPLSVKMNLGVLDAICITSTMLVILIGVIFMKEKIRWYIYPFMIVALGSSAFLAIVST